MVASPDTPQEEGQCCHEVYALTCSKLFLKVPRGQQVGFPQPHTTGSWQWWAQGGKRLLGSRVNQERCWSWSRVACGSLALGNMQPRVSCQCLEFPLLLVDLLGMKCLQLQSRNQTWATLLPETMSWLKITLSLEELI